MFEQTFKKIGDLLNKGAGCRRELQHVEQISWILYTTTQLQTKVAERKVFQVHRGQKTNL
jgi:hypothetical protein